MRVKCEKECPRLTDNRGRVSAARAFWIIRYEFHAIHLAVPRILRPCPRESQPVTVKTRRKTQWRSWVETAVDATKHMEYQWEQNSRDVVWIIAIFTEGNNDTWMTSNGEQRHRGTMRMVNNGFHHHSTMRKLDNRYSEQRWVEFCGSGQQ